MEKPELPKYVQAAIKRLAGFTEKKTTTEAQIREAHSQVVAALPLDYSQIPSDKLDDMASNYREEMGFFGDQCQECHADLNEHHCFQTYCKDPKTGENRGGGDLVCSHDCGYKLAKSEDLEVESFDEHEWEQTKVKGYLLPGGFKCVSCDTAKPVLRPKRRDRECKGRSKVAPRKDTKTK